MTADIIITLVLSLLGIGLVLVEIFLLPGVTIAGIVGGLFGFGSVWYAYEHLGSTGGTITLSLSLAVFCGLFVWLVRSKAINKIGLETNIDAKVDTDVDKICVGEEGVTISRLNPIGKIKVGGISMEGKSISGFIDEGVEIVVVKIDHNQVLVKEVVGTGAESAEDVEKDIETETRN